MCNFFKKLFPGTQGPISTEVLTGEESTPKFKKKYYVGVGINAYANAPLRGCVNDIEDSFLYLVDNKGFQQGDDMRLLIDERATKQAILDRLEWLVSKSEPDTLVVFQYSGHGTQVPNRNYDGEVDGMDEVICPVDFDWQGTWISDDQLADYIDRIARKGATPTFIIDACHSGTMLKDIPNIFSRKSISRFYPMPIDIAARITKNVIKRTMNTEINEQAVLVSGCQDNQTSADAYIDGKYNGALTKHLLDLAKQNPNYTWKQLITILPKAVKASGYEQTPSITGGEALLNQKIFG